MEQKYSMKDGLEYTIRMVEMKDGLEYTIRMVEMKDAEKLLKHFQKVHLETDYLLSHSDEIGKVLEEEEKFLKDFLQNERQFFLAAFVKDELIASLGISMVINKKKGRHRASLGISIYKQYWGKGIGKTLVEKAIKKIKELEYEQVELGVFHDNKRALDLYKSLGFQEWGRIRRAFKQKDGSYQDEIMMGLFL